MFFSTNLVKKQKSVKADYLGVLLTIEDINLSYTGMMNALTLTFSTIMKECIESGSNISNNFEFEKYAL